MTLAEGAGAPNVLVDARYRAIESVIPRVTPMSATLSCTGGQTCTCTCTCTCCHVMCMYVSHLGRYSPMYHQTPTELIISNARAHKKFVIGFPDDSCHPPLSSALTFRSLFSSPSLERLCLQLVFTRFCLPRQTARRCPALHIATEDPSSSSSPRLCDSLRIKNIPCALSMFDVTRFLERGCYYPKTALSCPSHHSKA